LNTGYVNVPDVDNMAEGFEQPSETNFDFQAQDFESLCERLNF
jgi:hypothetical protein